MSVELGIQALLGILLGIYLFIESVTAIRQFTSKDRPLHISKYCFTALTGLWMCTNVLLGQIDWLAIAQGAALTSFVARRLLWRFGDKGRDNHQTHA